MFVTVIQGIFGGILVWLLAMGSLHAITKIFTGNQFSITRKVFKRGQSS